MSSNSLEPDFKTEESPRSVSPKKKSQRITIFEYGVASVMAVATIATFGGAYLISDFSKQVGLGIEAMNGLSEELKDRAIEAAFEIPRIMKENSENSDKTYIEITIENSITEANESREEK